MQYKPNNQLTNLFYKVVTHRFDAVSLSRGNYTIHSKFDGYSVMTDFYYKGKHYASIDTLPKRVTFYTDDERLKAQLITAVVDNGYELVDGTVDVA